MHLKVDEIASNTSEHHPYSVVGTLKVVQCLFSQCLNLFIGHTQFFAGPVDLKLACLEFVARQCSDRVCRKYILSLILN